MSDQQIFTATSAEAEQCIAVIAMAFSSDPVVRWFYPDPHQYLTYIPRLVRAFADHSLKHGATHYLGRFYAAAIWLPPEIHPDDEAIAALMEESVAPERQEAVFAFFEKVEGAHPEEPHWYLPMIATDPIHQGKGYGSALLRHALPMCDEQRMPAYLEATSERSATLYARHGFETIDTIQVGDSPPIFPMLRQPKSV